MREWSTECCSGDRLRNIQVDDQQQPMLSHDVNAYIMYSIANLTKKCLYNNLHLQWVEVSLSW